MKNRITKTKYDLFRPYLNPMPAVKSNVIIPWNIPKKGTINISRYEKRLFLFKSNRKEHNNKKTGTIKSFETVPAYMKAGDKANIMHENILALKLKPVFFNK